MIRQLAIAAAVMGLAACQPAAAPAEPAAEPAAAEPVEISTIYDWNWRAHGGSADLDFGDGDWAEGVSLFQLSCLPGSGRVEASWGADQPARLSSGGSTLDLTVQEAGASAGDPVFKALRASGELTVTQANSAKTLVGKAAGKKAVEEFFAYCTTPPAG